MFTHYRTRGFVTKKEDKGEADRLFTFFTEDFGKLELLARAERKIGSKLRAGLEIFYLSEIEFIQGKNQKTLTDSILINKFPNLRADFKKSKVAYAIGGIVNRLVKGQEQERKIWDLLKEVFGELNKNSSRIQTWSLIYYYFLWNLLSFLGYELELQRCVLCQRKLRPEDVFFSSRDGGAVCGGCRKSVKEPEKISSNVIKVLRIFLKRDLKTLGRLIIGEKEMKEISSFSKRYLSEVLEKIE